jgi:DNA sulfur modification protein DndD
MIIKRVEVENYLCYYGLNTFQFADGLNIILGENNEGKTKFYEAVDWLFNGAEAERSDLISAKKMSEISDGDSFKVSVSMTVIQYDNEYKLTRGFTVVKESGIEISSVYFEGEEKDNTTGERFPREGQSLLQRIFPFQIRKYSMFKGETELNIFENDEALANLIALFSDARHYEKYSEKGVYLRDKAEKAVQQSTKQNQANQKLYNSLESDIATFQRERDRIRVLLLSVETEREKLDRNIQEAEKYANNAKDLETINLRIEKIDEKISLADRIIDTNFTQSLFDDNWILVNFEPIQLKFAEKIVAHSKLRREMQSNYDKEIGIREGEKRVKAELINNAIPLPDNIPSKAIMEEMLGEEICKVCNREAKKGSDAYKFMMKRLKSYLQSQSIEDDGVSDLGPLFKFDFSNRLENLSLRHEDNLKYLRQIHSDIENKFELVKRQRESKIDLEKLKEEEKESRQKILGDSSIADESKLLNVFQNYTSWQDDMKSLNENYFGLNLKYQGVLKNIELKQKEKDRIDMNNANSFFLKTRDILRHIEAIFTDSKERKFDEFIDKLESKSNKYLSQINVEAFTGRIKFAKRRLGGDRVKIEVSLIEDGGRHYIPGTAVRTSMNISILLAISELANEVRDETYPMIFDAPTSSFGETKTGDFLNLIYETSNQKIILLKDFIGSVRDSSSGAVKDWFIKDEFKSIKRNRAFWVKLERPFEKNDLSSINTNVIQL